MHEICHPLECVVVDLRVTSCLAEGAEDGKLSVVPPLACSLSAMEECASDHWQSIAGSVCAKENSCRVLAVSCPASVSDKSCVSRFKSMNGSG